MRSSMMEKIKLTNSNHSIDYYSKSLVLLLIPILLVNILFSLVSIQTIRKQNIDGLTNSIDIYAYDMKQKLNAVDHFMLWTVLHESALDDMEEYTSFDSYQTSLYALRTRVNDFQYSSGSQFNFFLYLGKKNQFTNISSITMNYLDYTKLHDFFLNHDEPSIVPKSTGFWQRMTINKTDYLYRRMVYQDREIYSVISINDILMPLNKLELGKEGYVTFTLPKEQTIAEATKLSWNANLFDNFLLSFSHKKTDLPFDISISVDYFSAFRSVMVLQITMMLLPILISFFAIIILLYIQKRVLQPIRSFSENLSQLKDNHIDSSFENTGILELENANIQIRDMVKEIQKLRIDVYEIELAQKKAELNYLKLQIKPHFYLNILSTIHGMSQTKNYDEIDQIIIATSNYLRYLFQTDRDNSRLTDELSHIKNYLDIQKVRYGDDFHFAVSINPKFVNAEIPPLVLQTFIENTVKHGLFIGEPLIIQLIIDSENKAGTHMRITIKDNGPGFKADILEKLQAKKSLISETGKHIGITSIRERLDLLYGNNYSLHFDNQVSRGVIITLILPFYPFKEEKE